MIAGKYQSKTEPPFTPGNEVAGVVTEVVRFDAQRQLDRRCPETGGVFVASGFREWMKTVCFSR